MTAPRFRSTAAFTMRQRHTAPAIDRATFVIFSLGGQRYAAPAESVERVLRYAQSEAHALSLVEHNGRQVTVIDLRDVLQHASRELSCDESGHAPPMGGSPPPSRSMALGQRTLVFSVQDAWVAATVDAVYEVATIDATLVRPVEAESDLRTVAPTAVVRGRFVRHDHHVLVLDLLRVVRAVYVLTQHRADVASVGASTPGS